MTVTFTGATDAGSADRASLHYFFSTSPTDRDAATYAISGTSASQDFVFPSSGTYVVYGRVLDKDGGRTDYQTTITVLSLPSVQGVQVNNGDVQRSMVNGLTVTFSEVVTLAAGAIEIRDAAGNLIPATLTVNTQVVGGHTVAMLTFSGVDVVGGSLADGRYTLTVRADKVAGSAGTMAADYVFAFYRLFGDGNGDGVVDVDDLLAFAAAYGSGEGAPGYLGYFDYNADGVIDVDDLLAFADRYGSGL